VVPNAKFFRRSIRNSMERRCCSQRRSRSRWQRRGPGRPAFPDQDVRHGAFLDSTPQLDNRIYLGAFVRRDGYNYDPSANPFADLGAPGQSEAVSPRRTLTNSGLRSDIAVAVMFKRSFLTRIAPETVRRGGGWRYLGSVGVIDVVIATVQQIQKVGRNAPFLGVRWSCS